MTTTPIEITQHHLNLTGQNVLTFVSWALTIILLAVTVEMGRRERSRKDCVRRCDACDLREVWHAVAHWKPRKRRRNQHNE